VLLFWWCPFKIQKEKWPGLQFMRTDYLSFVLTPLRIRWTIPLRGHRFWHCVGYQKQFLYRYLTSNSFNIYMFIGVSVCMSMSMSMSIFMFMEHEHKFIWQKNFDIRYWIASKLGKSDITHIRINVNSDIYLISYQNKRPFVRRNFLRYQTKTYNANVRYLMQTVCIVEQNIE
jgi:hypothetical protein